MWALGSFPGPPPATPWGGPPAVACRGCGGLACCYPASPRCVAVGRHGGRIRVSRAGGRGMAGRRSLGEPPFPGGTARVVG